VCTPIKIIGKFHSYSLHEITIASESIVEVNAISSDIEGGLRGNKALQTQCTNVLHHSVVVQNKNPLWGGVLNNRPYLPLPVEIDKIES
jgi:hypothetical protein